MNARVLSCAVFALSLVAAPSAVAKELPPTDVVKIHGGNQGCQPDYPCDIEPITVTVDKTYPSRLVAWAKP
jgi:hypothetical protein